MKLKQEKLAKKFIEDVPKFGWSRETLLDCSKRLKISTSELARIFPSFEYDVLEFLINKNNELVSKNFEAYKKLRLRTRDKIKNILELKFENNFYLKDALPEMLRFLLRPGNIFLSLKKLHANSDFIWKLAGDTSNDFSRYTKRGILSLVYLSILVYWINDNSKNSIATKSFINRSVDYVVDGMSKLKQASFLKDIIRDFFSKNGNNFFSGLRSRG